MVKRCKNFEPRQAMAAIVLLDDDEVILNMMRRMLEMEGHTVATYPDAAPALDEVDFKQVDLIVTDLKMPTSGEDFIRTLRERRIQVPIIVLSGNITEEKALHLKTLGAQEIIKKPFDLYEFLETIQVLI
jgi:DNA-binding response OmpR family regulator